MGRLSDIAGQENALIISHGGRIPEANSCMNDLQREKIVAIYEKYGKAYLGKVNHYDAERAALTEDSVYAEHTGEMVYNFDADFVVPTADNELAQLIVQWNNCGQSGSVKLINAITNRVVNLGGVNLHWS